MWYNFRTKEIFHNMELAKKAYGEDLFKRLKGTRIVVLIDEYRLDEFWNACNHDIGYGYYYNVETRQFFNCWDKVLDEYGYDSARKLFQQRRVVFLHIHSVVRITSRLDHRDRTVDEVYKYYED